MKKTYYLAIALLLAAASCDRSENSIYHEYDNLAASDTLYGRETTVPTDLLMPSKLLVLDNYLIVFDQKGDHLFKVFSLPNLEFIFSFGTIGNGPEEFIRVDQNTIQELNGNLVFVDNNKVVTVQLTGQGAQRISTKPIKLERNPINRLLMINDSTYITDNIEGDYEHRISNIKSGVEVKKFGNYPTEYSSFSNDIERYQAYLKTSVLHTTTNRFAVFYLYFNKMRIYDNDRLLVEANIDHSFGKYAAGEKPDIIFRSEPSATQRNIYLLNIEKRKRDIDFTNFLPNIEVWSWDGDLTAKYAVDKPIISFCISDKFGKMYATSLESPDKIYVFDLPGAPIEQAAGKHRLMYNDFYTARMPVPLDFATATPEKEKNKITKHNGLLYNSCIFAIPLEQKAVHAFKGSIAIVIASEDDTNKESRTLEEFVQHRDQDIKKRIPIYTATTSTINRHTAVISYYEYKGVDPQGVPFHLKSQKWRWKEQEKFIEIEYSSTEDFEAYVEEIEPLVTSFRLTPEVSLEI